ncbi:MAG: hypothetical protein JW730_13255 [Anaerolineales bacterium]|nr:hypothetical protein [Anaerolineales bacterium]
MSEPLLITSSDPILETLHFKPYRSTVVRRVVPFFPAPGEPQSMDIDTPWGTQLTARKGDFLVSEVETPDDYWPIDPVIFEESYEIVRPGYCVKKAITLLAPLTDITGDPDRKVTIMTLEGGETVRAGDFYLARGVRGEIWPYPREKIGTIMLPAE